MDEILPRLIFLAGIGQLGVLVASALVPFQLDWKHSLSKLPRLHRQMYLIYCGYVVLGIVTLGLTSLLLSSELAAGSALAVAFSIYAALFWGIRLGLQAILDVRPYLTSWWLRLGYHLLSVLFASFTAIFCFTAIRGIWFT